MQHCIIAPAYTSILKLLCLRDGCNLSWFLFFYQSFTYQRMHFLYWPVLRHYITVGMIVSCVL
jgi:hypothetical protein